VLFDYTNPSYWFHIYLPIKDARSLEHKVSYFPFIKATFGQNLYEVAMFHAAAIKMAYFIFVPHLLGFQTVASFKDHLHVVRTLKRRKDFGPQLPNYHK